jgi:acylpyruvate hydrolase
LFAKFAETLAGPFDTIRLPDDRTDWEAELVVVIGSSVHRASTAQAEAAIAGFTVGNDISVRAYQARTSQWLQGKCFEATAPIGPWLVTTDETSTWPRVDITLSVDGVTKQQSTTADLLFGPAELVEYISHVITLRPGDLIFTGTPSGVGMARDPQEFLRGGQVVETTIDTIGTLRNRCDG